MNQIEVTGMILVAGPIGENDRRVEILTKDRGRISAFARGARRQNSPLLSITNPFVFGTFTLYAGRNSYTLLSGKVENYFAELRSDINGAYYGMYFLEMSQYFSREGNDEIQTLRLLYQSIKMLGNDKISNELIKVIFELKMMVIQGEGLIVDRCVKCNKDKFDDVSKELVLRVDQKGIVCKHCLSQLSYYSMTELDDSTLYTLQYVTCSKIENLYSFTVKDEVLRKLEKIMNLYTSLNIDKKFKTLEFLELL